MPVVGVAWRGSRSDFEDFAERHGLQFTQIDDSEGLLFDAFGVPSQPAYARLSPDGDITVHSGTLDAAELLEFARG